MPNPIRSSRKRVTTPARRTVKEAALRRMPVYWVMRRDQLIAVASAIRHDVLFRPIAPLIRLARAPNDARNRPLLARIAKTMASQAAADYSKAFQHMDWVIDGPARNHWVFRCMTAPSPQRLAKINEHLEQLARLIWTPDPKPGRLMSVTWLLSPIGSAMSESSRHPGIINE